MNTYEFLLTFDGDDVSVAAANRYASELRDQLLDATPDVTVEQHRQDPNAQDFGAALLLVLGAPAAVAIAKGIQDWLGRRPEAEVTVRHKNGEVIVKNVSSKDALKALETALSDHG